MSAPDMVNRPPHYADTRIECLDAIQAMVEKWPGESAYLGGNILKYIWRHRGKTPVESLKKARFYLDRLIALVEASEAAPSFADSCMGKMCGCVFGLPCLHDQPAPGSSLPPRQTGGEE